MRKLSTHLTLFGAAITKSMFVTIGANSFIDLGGLNLYFNNIE